MCLVSFRKFLRLVSCVLPKSHKPPLPFRAKCFHEEEIANNNMEILSAPLECEQDLWIYVGSHCLDILLRGKSKILTDKIIVTNQ